jgi:hypothetical protein
MGKLCFCLLSKGNSFLQLMAQFFNFSLIFYTRLLYKNQFNNIQYKKKCVNILLSTLLQSQLNKICRKAPQELCNFNNEVQHTQNFTLELDNRQILKLLFEMRWLTTVCHCRKMSLVLKTAKIMIT